VLRNLPALESDATAIGAGLKEFGSINPVQSNMAASDNQRIAIERHRWPGKILCEG